MDKKQRAKIIDILLIAMIVLPFVACMVLKVLTKPASEGISITGAQIYFTIPMPVMDMIISEAQITSHRGSSFEAPENTIAAIELAIENLADCVEIDVQETKDGELVLFHDSNLQRITGKKGRICKRAKV